MDPDGFLCGFFLNLRPTILLRPWFDLCNGEVTMIIRIFVLGQPLPSCRTKFVNNVAAGEEVSTAGATTLCKRPLTVAIGGILGSDNNVQVLAHRMGNCWTGGCCLNERQMSERKEAFEGLCRREHCGLGGPAFSFLFAWPFVLFHCILYVKHSALCKLPWASRLGEDKIQRNNCISYAGSRESWQVSRVLN